MNLKRTLRQSIVVATAVVGCTAFSSSASAQSVTVQSGDSLWKISQRYDASVASIQQANDLDSSVIYVGQSLTIPSHQRTYHVQPGDSLWSISQDQNVSVTELMETNQLSSTMIYVGQALTLPSDSTVNRTDALISTAKEYIGVPYVWGGDTPSGFDCSGFIHHVFSKHDIDVPRTTATIYQAGSTISTPKRGDLVFFETYKAGPSHAGIYLGNGQFIHASSSKGITISSMDNPYWSPRYIGAKAY